MWSLDISTCSVLIEKSETTLMEKQIVFWDISEGWWTFVLQKFILIN